MWYIIYLCRRKSLEKMYRLELKSSITAKELLYSNQQGNSLQIGQSVDILQISGSTYHLYRYMGK